MSILCSSPIIAQVSNVSKQYAIESAQMANETFLYTQKSYFTKGSLYAAQHIDTALVYIKESIISIDSAIFLASDSDRIALEYANIARNYAIDSYNTLSQIKNNTSTGSVNKKKEWYKNAMSNAENATVDAYHASFYFNSKIEKPKENKDSTIAKEAQVDTLIKDKLITKLDIDQTLFTLLNEDLKNTEEINNQELKRLKEELLNTKDALKIAELSKKIKQLELVQKGITQKKNDAQQKLLAINKLIQTRDSSAEKKSIIEETIFTKGALKKVDNWNNQLQLDNELPDVLFYQLQLGVYKKEVIPATFKGLNPIYGKTTEQGISYSTGFFEKLAYAREAKSYVVKMGLKDTFIIAYYKKNKISLKEAIKLEEK